MATESPAAADAEMAPAAATASAVMVPVEDQDLNWPSDRPSYELLTEIGACPCPFPSLRLAPPLPSPLLPFHFPAARLPFFPMDTRVLRARHVCALGWSPIPVHPPCSLACLCMCFVWCAHTCGLRMYAFTACRLFVSTPSPCGQHTHAYMHTCTHSLTRIRPFLAIMLAGHGATAVVYQAWCTSLSGDTEKKTVAIKLINLEDTQADIEELRVSDYPWKLLSFLKIALPSIIAIPPEDCPSPQLMLPYLPSCGVLRLTLWAGLPRSCCNNRRLSC